MQHLLANGFPVQKPALGAMPGAGFFISAYTPSRALAKRK